MRNTDLSTAQEGRRASVQKMAGGIFLVVLAVLLLAIYGPSEWMPSARLAPTDPADITPLARFGLWLKTLTVGRMTPVLVLVAFVALLGAGVREMLRDEEKSDAPRVLAVLLAVYALLWMTLSVFADPWFLQPAAAARAKLPPPSSYHVVVGLLWIASALYLYFGRRAARGWYGVSLAIALVWSGAEFGVASRTFWMQVTAPALLAFYIFSWRVTGRLLPPQD